MSSRISYMGTKHNLAPKVREAISKCQPGRVLDAFAGMGAVAEALAGRRQVWTNDIQHFAQLAAACRLADPAGPVGAKKLAKMAQPLFQENLASLRSQNSKGMALVKRSLDATDFKAFTSAATEASELIPMHRGAFGCFLKTYSHGYFSLEQSAQIDSIRYALALLKGQGLLSTSQFDWGIVALGHAMLRVANTTGHFAQYLTANQSNYLRVIKQHQRDIWDEWILSVCHLRPVGTRKWREGNFTTRSNATSLLGQTEYKNAAQVVYCDPPYTDDQYSRYYHVWETLVLYDYPTTSGQGRYRPGRFTTDFSLVSRVESAFIKLVDDVSQIGADLVLSYPSNGLLHSAGSCPLDIIRSRYPNARIETEISHNHSTMGASKGPSKAPVKEIIYVANANC